MPLPFIHDHFSYLYADWSLSHKNFAYYDVYEKRWKYIDNTYVADMPPPVLGRPRGFPSIARLILQETNGSELAVEED
jgi:hypothetical protein